ncbi:MAG: hypothetical protein J6A15_04920 [Clostridia bacterium]|nr:hypothetical protein [Clostridia bacterium]
MDEDNLSKAIMIGVTTLIGVMTVSAIIIFFNSSLDLVRGVGDGKDYGTVYRSDIESTLLMSGTGNNIKGTSVINLLNYYAEDVNVAMVIQNIKYLDENQNVQIYGNITIDSKEISVRQSGYNTAMRYIMDNQDFTIDVQEIDPDAGVKIITIKGV